MFLLWPTLLLIFYGLPYYFSTVLRATSARVHCDTSVYTVSHYARTAQVRSRLSFLKLFTGMGSEAEHKTSSSWSCDMNLNLSFSII